MKNPAAPKGSPPVDLKAGFARKVRCPRCAAEFETPRRWDLLCAECGHQWQESSVQTRSDKLTYWFGDVADRVVMPLLLLLAASISIALIAPLFYIIWRYSSFGGLGALVAGVMLCLLAMAFSALWFNRYSRNSSIQERARDYYRRHTTRRRGN